MTMTDRTALTDDSRWPLKLAAFVAIALGVLALFSPLIAGLVVTLVLGANFLISGVLEAFAAFKAERWSGTIGLMLLAIISIIAGLRHLCASVAWTHDTDAVCHRCPFRRWRREDLLGLQGQ